MTNTVKTTRAKKATAKKELITLNVKEVNSSLQNFAIAFDIIKEVKNTSLDSLNFDLAQNEKGNYILSASIEFTFTQKSNDKKIVIVQKSSTFVNENLFTIDKEQMIKELISTMKKNARAQINLSLLRVLNSLETDKSQRDSVKVSAKGSVFFKNRKVKYDMEKI